MHMSKSTSMEVSNTRAIHLLTRLVYQIVARYFMGYWPAKITCLLNMIIMVGYGTISCIIAGQILSAVSGGSMSIVVGIIITAFVSWLVAVFGMAIFHSYERQDTPSPLPQPP